MAGFLEIIGHEQIVSHLKNAIEMEKVSHAYILNGPDYSGKMMLAEAFAMALVCEGDKTATQGDACKECRSCKQAMSRNHPDIIYVDHEKPNTIGVDDIRHKLNNDIVIKPYSSKYKIYIVDEAEKMNEAAQNALLKTIEEPPAYAIIMLLSNNAEGFLQTILSRCVSLNLKTVKEEEIRDFLMKKHLIPDYQAEICAAFSQGNVGKAIHLASSEEFHELKTQALKVIKKAQEANLYERAELVQQIVEYKDQIAEFLDLVTMWYRDVLYYKATTQTKSLIFKDEIYDIKKQAARYSFLGINEILEAIEEMQKRIRFNVNFESAAELFLLKVKES